MTTMTTDTLPARVKTAKLSPADVARLFDEGYRDVEILPDGHLREAPRNGHDPEETVTRTLKTKRTWY